jgi:ribosomal protein S26
MGVTYKPEDARRRRTKDKALKDLDPSLREPTKKIIENTAEDLPISKQIKGQIREEVGKLTDNKTEQLKGKIEQVQGKVQEGIGNENLIKCLKCGYEIPEDSNYCKFCGIRQGSYIIEEFKVAAIEILKRVEVLLHEGDITRIVVKDESGKQLFEISATVGVMGAIRIPWMAALGVIASIATNCTIVVEKRA